MVPVPVAQPAEQLIGTALISLLTNDGLQRARAVLVHPQQRGVVHGRRRGRGGRGEAEPPAGRLPRASAVWQAGLRRARGVRGPGIALGGRDLLGFGGALGCGAGGSPGL